MVFQDPETRRLSKQAAREIGAIRDLALFVRYMWPVVESGTRLTWNWHLDAICQELTLVQPLGITKELVVNIPPGHMKSLLVSVFWPAWLWLQRPEERQLFFTNDQDLALRDSRRTRTILKSEEYRALVARIDRAQGRDPERKDSWTHRLSLKADQNEKKNFENEAGGFRVCLGVGSSVTGKRGDGMIIDDPYDAKEVVLGDPQRQAERMREIVDIYDKVLKSRLNSEEDGYRVIIMQRLHFADLAGVRIKEGARCCVLPTAYDPDHPNVYPGDPRTEPGELLCPARLGLQADQDNRKAFGARHYAAQHGQRPSPPGGGTFKQAHMRHYQGDPQRVALTCGEISLSVDCNFKGDKKGSDFVVVAVWGKAAKPRPDGFRYLLLDRVRARLTLPDTIATLQRLSRKWARVRTILVEAKANGDGLIQMLRTMPRLATVVPYDPKASKLARAEMAAVSFEGLEVGLPDPEYAPWIDDWIEEHLTFPVGDYDDQVDTTSQQIIRWTGGETPDPLERLAQLRAASGLG